MSKGRIQDQAFSPVFPMVGLAIVGICGIATNGSTSSLIVWAFAVLCVSTVYSVIRWLRCAGSDVVAPAVVGPLMIALGFIPIVLIPVFAQSSGIVGSKLARAGLPIDEALDANIWYVIVLSVSLAFCGAGALWGGIYCMTRGRRSFQGKFFASGEGSLVRRTHTVFVALGIVGYFASLGLGLSDGAESRGAEDGRGLEVMVGWFLPLSISMGFAYRHFGSRRRLAVSLFGCALLLLGGVRSPFLLILVAVVVGSLKSQRFGIRGNERTSYRLALLAVIGVGMGLVSAFISQWRGNQIAGENQTVTSLIGEIFGNPLSAVARSGLDSYDGIRLAFIARRSGLEGSAFDPLKGIVNLVPRSIYPDKQQWLGNQLTEELLGWGKGGIFLSGMGYFYFLMGSILVAFALVFAVGFAVGYIEVAAGTNLIAVTLVVYFVLRFLMGGDAFDLHHVLMLCIVCILATFAVRISTFLFPISSTDGGHKVSFGGSLALERSG
ncbi:hypothetical protein F1734_21550 [Rhodococcus ruber]|uniref:hypothetical protein n=1 Tax=Rhodococcus ruber TaxID=1830 RepID=UPI001932046B|nr:hypothetical protein [Rhodococcus ruber]QRE82578.1 hypothetical protein F1734_21550 [Rhodococcus ruber]